MKSNILNRKSRVNTSSEGRSELSVQLIPYHKSMTPRIRNTLRQESSSNPSLLRVCEIKFTPENDKWDGHYEFGGIPGCFTIIVFSHCVMYYFFTCIKHFKGFMVYPGHALFTDPAWIMENPSLDDANFFDVFTQLIARDCAPTVSTFAKFSCFVLFEYVLAVVLPGPSSIGLSLPSENGRKLSYKCNAISAWYIVLACLVAVHFSGIFPLHQIFDDFGHYMTAAILWANGIAGWVYVDGLLRHRAFRMSGNHLYDFFMGSQLNPRLPGGVDLKMFAEIRNSWVLLFVLSVSCTAKMNQVNGSIGMFGSGITRNMGLLNFAHLLYVNACQKGEECIPTTYDIFYEKFGWMLIYWNFAGVPFLYCFQALHLGTNLQTFEYSEVESGILLLVLVVFYFVWDTTNSQKNRFRMKRSGVSEDVIRRKTFPQLPWGYIENPRTIKSDRGELFVDGWYRYARKLHYTADIGMALVWGYTCGFGCFIPYFYVCIFSFHLIHRQLRDDDRCKKKYGPLWSTYTKLVPYRFIPGLF